MSRELTVAPLRLKNGETVSLTLGLSVTCPNLACREQFSADKRSDRATCPRCGNQFPWKKSTLIRGTRGQA